MVEGSPQIPNVLSLYHFHQSSKILFRDDEPLFPENQPWLITPVRDVAQLCGVGHLPAVGVFRDVTGIIFRSSSRLNLRVVVHD